MNIIQRNKLIYFLNQLKQINYFSTSHLETQIKDDIYFIKFNRPEKRNCLNFKSIRLLRNQLNELNNNDEINKIVLYGEDGNFCSGLDLNELNKDNENELIDLYSNQNWFKSNKLLISYVQGYAVGLGFELSINCDLLILDQTAKLGFLNRRFGLPSLLPLDKLRNLIGRFNTLNILDNAILINSKEAFNIGLTKYVLDENGFNLNEFKDNKLNDKLNNKLDGESDDKLDARLNNKLDSKSNNKLDARLNHKLDSRLNNKLNDKLDNKLTIDQIIKSLDQLKIDSNKLAKLKSSHIKIDNKFNKFNNNLPDEWRNMNLNSKNYNLNRNRHGRFDLSFWDQIENLQKSNH